VLNALLDVIMPVLVVVAVGAAIGRFLKPDATTVSKVTLYALSPSLALYNLAHSQANLTSAVKIVLGYILFMLIMGRVTWLSSRDQPDETRRAMVAGVITGNNGNFGLPIALFAFGKSGLELALVVFTISVFMTFVVTPSVLKEGSWRSRVKTVFALPVVWAALLGVALNSLGVRIPVALDRGIALLAEAAVPMLLISLGLQIGSSGFPIPSRAMIRAVALRLVLGPCVAFFVAWLVGATGLERGVLVLSSAMPTAINAFLVAQELKADAKLIGGIVILTTFLSVPVIALIVTLLR
jgi:malate permease and related proteins